MAPNRFTISMLALLLLASPYVSATTIEELCKRTFDPSYCVTLLKPQVSESTDFNSEFWTKRIRSMALEKVKVAQDFMIEQVKNVGGSDLLAANICDSKLRESVRQITNGDHLDFAATSIEACYDSLEGSSGILLDVRTKVDEAAKATKIISELA